MSATAPLKGRIVGFTACMGADPEIVPWQPLSKAGVDALPPLPAPASRPPLLRPAAGGITKGAVVDSEGASARKSTAADRTGQDQSGAPKPETTPAAVEVEEECGFQLLHRASPEKIAPFLVHEHPQTVALILSQLAPGLSAGILAQLDEQLQADLIHRISTMENVTPKVLDKLEKMLEEQLRSVLDGDQDVGGPKVAADILNLTGSSVEKTVLDQMDSTEPQIAEAVRNLMFVFADIGHLSDRDIQVVLGEVDQKDLVIALKAAVEEAKDKILGNMSEKVRTFITEEMELLGPMRLSEVEEVQLRIVQQVRHLEEQGKVTIVRGDSDDKFV